MVQNRVFFSVKNHNKFSSQNIVISSQNNVPHYHPRRHEKDYQFDCLDQDILNIITVKSQTVARLRLKEEPTLNRKSVFLLSDFGKKI